MARNLTAPLIPASYRLENIFFTPRTYLRAVTRAIPVKFDSLPHNFSVPAMILDPALVMEPLDWAYNRTREGDPEVPIMRVTILLLHLRKST
ncbi:MAG: hypothetical protein JXA97_11025 [Anaerolineales bacterium]|nr:hypothetical protein [Anaerolineales bacterium]